MRTVRNPAKPRPISSYDAKRISTESNKNLLRIEQSNIPSYADYVQILQRNSDSIKGLKGNTGPVRVTQ